MILFEEDWAKYPDAIIDTQTRNKSALRLASVYREMGVKNAGFILALHNPELQGVDPFDYANLTDELVGLIIDECFENPWYFFRECARVPPQAGEDAIHMELNRGNVALYWTFFNHILIILIQPRQTGKSFGTDVLMDYLLNIGCRDTQINLLTKDETLRGENIKRLKEVMDYFPYYLNFRTKKDANNTEKITINARNNVYLTHVPQASPKAAEKVGRGLTSPILHNDEGPFQPNIKIALPAALSSMDAVAERAKRAGAHHGVILTTTAGKKDDPDGKYVYDLVSTAAVWDEAFMNCRNLEHLTEVITKATRNPDDERLRGGVLRINATFSHRQLGKTDQWLLSKIKGSLKEGAAADRDYFNRWTSGSQTSPLPVDVLTRIRASERDVAYTEISEVSSYITRWYVPKNQLTSRMGTSRFILGLDPSEAGGGDDIGLTITDVETFDVVAAGAINETNLVIFTQWLCNLLVKYPNLILNCERRSAGAWIIDQLLLLLPTHGIDPFKRIFNWVVNDYEENMEAWNEINKPMSRRDPSVYVRYKRAFGFATSGGGATSRSELYSTTLFEAAKRGGERTADKQLINQITGLITVNGRVDHAKGEHDDLVISWLLCWWLMTRGKNLSHYGIDPARIGCAAYVMKEESLEVQQIRYYQQKLRKDMMALFEKLSSEPDEYIAEKLELKLRAMERRLEVEDSEVFSLDQMLAEAREKRKQNKRSRHLIQNDLNRNSYSSRNFGGMIAIDHDDPSSRRYLNQFYGR